MLFISFVAFFLDTQFCGATQRLTNVKFHVMKTVKNDFKDDYYAYSCYHICSHHFRRYAAQRSLKLLPMVPYGYSPVCLSCDFQLSILNSKISSVNRCMLSLRLVKLVIMNQMRMKASLKWPLKQANMNAVRANVAKRANTNVLSVLYTHVGSSMAAVFSWPKIERLYCMFVVQATCLR